MNLKKVKLNERIQWGNCSMCGRATGLPLKYQYMSLCTSCGRMIEEE